MSSIRIVIRIISDGRQYGDMVANQCDGSDGVFKPLTSIR